LYSVLRLLICLLVLAAIPLPLVRLLVSTCKPLLQLLPLHFIQCTCLSNLVAVASPVAAAELPFAFFAAASQISLFIATFPSHP